MAGSHFNIPEAHFTKYGTENYKVLGQEAMLVPYLENLISGKDLTRDRIATILGSRALSIQAVENNAPEFFEISKKTLDLSVAERATCQDILESLKNIKRDLVRF
jgi:hypothetical protein